MNYLVDNIDNNVVINNTNLQIIDDKFTDLFTRIGVLENWRLVVNQRLIDIAVEQGVQNDRLDALNTNILSLIDSKVDKEVGKGLVCVDDLMTGNTDCVATIGDIRSEIDAINSVTLVTGDTNPLLEITTCQLNATPIKILSFVLDKGNYMLDGYIRHIGEVDASGELYFEVAGTTVEKSVVNFSGDGNAPISSLINIASDGTEVALYARRLSGLRLDVISNDRNKSYCRWVKVV